ncbi:MAG TPA: hypothetical protein VHY84_14880 [Bryobacteraceae bacterium]|jgi:hypothetical protein|nr:hypothetical protein [Bryobacteraceae bacterium]
MTVRFSATLELTGVPTVRHIRDIEESMRLALRRLCCVGADSLSVESCEIPDGKLAGSETAPIALERIA